MSVFCSFPPFDNKTYQQYSSFLASRGLRDEKDADVLALYYGEDDELLACGARKGSLLKQIAVSALLEGTGACASVVSALLQNAYSVGYTHLFLATKPGNLRMFSSMGFYPLAKSQDALLMENKKNGLEDFLKDIKSKGEEKLKGLDSYNNNTPYNIGAIVMNCNPFTLGHQYLIETAAKLCRFLYVFILSQEGSFFSPDLRFKLAQAGTSHIPNLLLCQSSQYLVSRATFPAYFIKEEEKVDLVRTDLDLNLFSQRIAPFLGVNVRFVGTEPFCKITALYNKRMQEILPKHNIKVEVVPRLNNISASFVRSLIKDSHLSLLSEKNCNLDSFNKDEIKAKEDLKLYHNLEEIKKIVPEATYNAIISNFR